MDHHVHSHSPAIVGFLPAFCASLSEGCSTEFATARSVDELLADMDAAGITGGSLLSTRYLAETAFLTPSVPNHAVIVHDANAFTVEQARLHPDRLMAFISVNPLTDTALPELAAWKGNPFVTGLKMHLTNSGVDLRNPDHVRKLAGVFRAADADDFAIVIHMRSEREDYGAEDVRIFVKDVLPAAHEIPVQIAHAGGWGGLDPNTLDALGAFADAIEADPSLRGRLYFDLASVWDKESTTDDLKQLATLIRRIDPAQFVPASDWPFESDLTGYYNKTYPMLPLTEVEWSVIRSNTAPYVPERIAH